MTAGKTTEYERSVELLGTAIGSLHSLDDDVEAHTTTKWSDENLKQTIAQVEEALGALRQLGGADDVEAHMYRYSDEDLKQTIAQVEGALGLLRGLGGAAGDTADVEGHSTRWSDESLKQAITSLQGALDALKAVGAPRR